MTSLTGPRLIAVLLAALCVTANSDRIQAGWLAGWDYRQEISVAASVTPADLTNFPLLVKITDSGNRLFSNVASLAGHDIAFTSADGVSIRPHEIEHFSASGVKELDAWVKTNVSSTAPTKLYMYYRNTDGLDHQNVPGTWNDSYKMVQHLQEASTAHLDSTQYANNGTGTGSPAPNAPGKVSGAVAFDQTGGVDDYVNVPDSASLSAIKTGLSIEYWVNRTTTGAGYHVLKQDAFGSLKDYGSTAGFWSSHETSGADYLNANISGMTTGNWHHVTSTWEPGIKKIYLDGALIASTATSTSNPLLQSGTSAVIIGNSLGWNGTDFVGSMDEVRLSDTSRDANWVQASFNNQDNPASYQSESSAQQKGDWLDGWGYRQAIAISKDATNVDLANFPALVKITDAGNNVFSQANSPNGLDVVFTDGDGVTLLDHDLEHFSKAAGSEGLNAWVNTSLSKDQDTLIYMYYRGPNSANPNSTDTWDANYRMVQHLAETSGTHNDATQYGNNMTAHNGVNQNATGQIDGADSLNGIANSQYLIAPDNMAIAADESFTLEAWVNFSDDGVSSQNQYIVSKYGRAALRGLSGGTPNFGMIWQGAAGGGWSSGQDITGDWHHVVQVYDASLGTYGRMFLFLDGVEISPAGGVSVNGLLANGGGYLAGSWATTYGFIPGTIDEVRISDIARGADWLATTFNFTDDPNAYLAFGAEQIVPEPTSLVLCTLGFLTLVGCRRRKRNRCLLATSV